MANAVIITATNAKGKASRFCTIEFKSDINKDAKVGFNLVNQDVAEVNVSQILHMSKVNSDGRMICSNKVGYCYLTFDRLVEFEVVEVDGNCFVRIYLREEIVELEDGKFSSSKKLTKSVIESKFKV